MKKNVSERSFILNAAVLFAAMFLIWAGTRAVYADYQLCGACGGTGRTMCPMCAGTGRRSTTIMQNQTIGFNPVTGMPQTIMVPTTSSAPCTTCGGSGKMYCPSCAGTGRRYVSTGTSTTPTTTKAPTPTPAPSSDSSAAKKTKNGTILEATDGIGNYEDAPNMLDGNTKTKFNVLATSAFVIWKAPKKIRVTSYSITTANDTATYTGRNPKTWVLYGSNKKLSRNDPGWKKIHAVSNDKKLKPVNYKKFTFKLKKAAKAYRYYKLEITANKGADCTQLAEFTLKGK